MSEHSPQRYVAKLRDKQDGVTAIEYALIAGMIALAIVAGATVAGTRAGVVLTDLGTQLLP